MTADPGIVRREVEVVNERGLHARVAARIASEAEAFDADIRIGCNGHTVSALSIMGLLMLAATRGTRVEIAAAGARGNQDEVPGGGGVLRIPLCGGDCKLLLVLIVAARQFFGPPD